MQPINYLLPAAILAAVLPVATLAQEEPLYVEVEKFLASDGGFGDHFGDTLALDGDTLVIGGDNIGPGGAYVYERNQGGSNAWGEVKKLLAPDVGENFGTSVALDGDRIAVGAFDTIENPGAVYFFERDEGGADNWGFTGKLTAPDDPAEATAFNRPAMDGETLLVGATGDDEAGAFSAGAVYIFTRDELAPAGWCFEEKILNPDPQLLDRFGQVVAIDGDTFAVGSPNDSRFQDGAGAVHLYERIDGVWMLQKELTAPEPEVDGEFGHGVALEGDTLVVGHPGEDGGFGGAYIYGRDVDGPGNWGLEANLTTARPDCFGMSVGLHQGTVVVGNDLSDLAGPPAGAAHVFERVGTSGWVEVADLLASDAAEFDRFGNAVGISGGTVLVGADQEDDDGLSAGAAYVFQLVAHPELTVTGTCPGELTLELTGATPSGPILLAHSTDAGLTVVPGGKCAGAELGLVDPRLLARFLAAPDGTATLVRAAPPAACGRYLQAVDGVTCGVGSVTQLP